MVTLIIVGTLLRVHSALYMYGPRLVQMARPMFLAKPPKSITARWPSLWLSSVLGEAHASVPRHSPYRLRPCGLPTRSLPDKARVFSSHGFHPYGSLLNLRRLSPVLPLVQARRLSSWFRQVRPKGLLVYLQQK